MLINELLDKRNVTNIPLHDSVIGISTWDNSHNDDCSGDCGGGYCSTLHSIPFDCVCYSPSKSLV